jgi:hypothetical protein
MSPLAVSFFNLKSNMPEPGHESNLLEGDPVTSSDVGHSEGSKQMEAHIANLSMEKPTSSCPLHEGTKTILR